MLYVDKIYAIKRPEFNAWNICGYTLSRYFD